jgi:glycosyltransferase involved in cell wall biosynthesis
MRILFGSPTFWPVIGGIEVLATELIVALQQRGHEFLVVADVRADDLPAESEHRGIVVRRFPFFRALAERDLARVLEIRAAVAALRRRLRPDVVHIYRLWPDVVFERDTARAHPAPRLITLHGPFPDQYVRPNTVLGTTLRSAGWVSTCSADLLGWVELEDVPALIDAATLVLMPSRDREGLPLVALQAAQLARPLVGSRIPGLDEVVLHEESGLLVESENSHALAEAIIRLLGQPELAARLGRAASRRARDVFSWERHVDAYEALYEQLAGRAARP